MEKPINKPTGWLKVDENTFNTVRRKYNTVSVCNAYPNGEVYVNNTCEHAGDMMAMRVDTSFYVNPDYFKKVLQFAVEDFSLTQEELSLILDWYDKANYYFISEDKEHKDLAKKLTVFRDSLFKKEREEVDNFLPDVSNDTYVQDKILEEEAQYWAAKINDGSVEEVDPLAELRRDSKEYNYMQKSLDQMTNEYLEYSKGASLVRVEADKDRIFTIQVKATEEYIHFLCPDKNLITSAVRDSEIPYALGLLLKMIKESRDGC